MRFRAFLLSALMLLCIPGARADEVTEQLDVVRQLYEEGDIGGAISELQFALEALRDKLTESLAETFPDPPAGWKAGKVERQGAAAALGGGIVVERTYEAVAGNGRVAARIAANNPMVQMVSSMLTNPAMIAAQPNAKRVRIGRRKAILTQEPENRSADLNLVVGPVLITLEGTGIEDSGILISLMKGFDLKRIRALLSED